MECESCGEMSSLYPTILPSLIAQRMGKKALKSAKDSLNSDLKDYHPIELERPAFFEFVISQSLENSLSLVNHKANPKLSPCCQESQKNLSSLEFSKFFQPPLFSSSMNYL